MVGEIPWRRTWQPTPVLLPGETPWTKEPGRLQSMGSQRVGRNWATKYSTWEENLPTLDSISRPTHFSQPLSLLLVSFLPLQFPLCLPLTKTNKYVFIFYGSVQDLAYPQSFPAISLSVLFPSSSSVLIHLWSTPHRLTLHCLQIISWICNLWNLSHITLAPGRLPDM